MHISLQFLNSVNNHFKCVTIYYAFKLKPLTVQVLEWDRDESQQNPGSLTQGLLLVLCTCEESNLVCCMDGNGITHCAKPAAYQSC